MSNEWNDQGTGGHQGPGPQFDPGQAGPQDQYGQQYPAGQRNPNNQPSYDQQQANHLWPQNQQLGNGGSGPQPHPGQQSYPGQQPYPGQQAYAGQQVWSQNQPQAAAPASRSSVLGVVGLVVVVLATGALIAAAWSFGAGLADFFLDLAGTGFPRDPDALVNDPRTIAYAEGAAGTIVAAVLSCVVGLVGWIISIVATATRRGRVFGIIGIVLGVLSLPLAYATVSLVLSPVLNQLGG